MLLIDWAVELSSALEHWLTRINGGVIDRITVVVALAAVVLTVLARAVHGYKFRQWFDSGACSRNAMNAAVVPMFVFVFLSPFNHKVLEEIGKTSSITLSLGGLLGVLFAIGELDVLRTPNGGDPPYARVFARVRERVAVRLPRAKAAQGAQPED